jgi:hypothetical protein
VTGEISGIKQVKLPKRLQKVVQISEEYSPEKTSDIYLSVRFTYPKKRKAWAGSVPIRCEDQGLALRSSDDVRDVIVLTYDSLAPGERRDWKKSSEQYWRHKQRGQTYRVLKALESGEWLCRVCGPVPKVNPQPAARLRALRKIGYTIISKRISCPTCRKKTMHDLLVLLPRAWHGQPTHGNELRAPMSDSLKDRIKKVLGRREAFFDVTRAKEELLIDHKFPSQRWRKPESLNPDDMPNDEIRRRFQLLTHQTNMLKSRACDKCVRTGIRATFVGLRWYYIGDGKWRGKTRYDEKGCIGCPWYDLQRWRGEFDSKFSKE